MAHIKLAFCIGDQEYAGRLINYFTIHNQNQFELGSFTKADSIKDYFRTKTSGDVNVVVIDDQNLSLSADFEGLADKIVCISESSHGKEQGVHFINKYQRADLILKDIMSACSDIDDFVISTHSRVNENAETKCVLFCPVKGGSGASTAASAYSKYQAKHERSVILLNFETLGNIDTICQADGKFTFDEIIFALKSRHGSLSLKIESSLRQDNDGVYFFAESTNAVDKYSLTKDDYRELFHTLRTMHRFDEIVVDTDLMFNETWFTLADEASKVILVNQGGKAGNAKIVRLSQLIESATSSCKVPLTGKLFQLYNNSPDAERVELEAIPTIGGCPVVRNGMDVARALSQVNIWEKI